MQVNFMNFVVKKNVSAIVLGSLLIAVMAFGICGLASAASPREMLPEKVKKAGVIRVATPLDYAPYGWLDPDSVEPKGFEPDVGRAIGEILGVEWKVYDIKWEGLITGIGSGRHEVGAAGITDKVDRRANGNFVDFNTSSNAVVIDLKDADKYKTVHDLCGQSMGTCIGTTTVIVGREISDECVAKGKDPIKISEYPTVPANDLAMKSGRVPAIVVTTPQAGWAIASGKQPWKMIGSGYKPDYLGFLVTKTIPGLDEAILAAVKELYKSGKLKEIADKYGLGQSIIEPGMNLQK